MTIRRFITLMALALAACSTALVGPGGANASYIDALHQHGWNAYFGPVQPAGCSSLLFNGKGTVSVAVPDLMTTPVGNQARQTVYFKAALEYYDGARGWSQTFWNGSRWVYLPASDWYYTSANTVTTGFYPSWRELSTNRYGTPRIGFDATPGYYYRFRIFYYWGYDGTQHNDATNYCLV